MPARRTVVAATALAAAAVTLVPAAAQTAPVITAWSGTPGAGPAHRLGVAPAGMTMWKGRLYVADRANAVVRAVDPATGATSVVAGSGLRGYAGDGGPATRARLVEPADVALAPDGRMYVADAFGYASSARTARSTRSPATATCGVRRAARRARSR